MIRYLDDRCLANFVATYEFKNLRLAAEKVGLTQPAMSKSLSRIEADLGVQLFERKNRGLEPTPAAHELYDCAIKIELRTRQSLLRISALETNLSGSLRVGAGHMWSWLRMPNVLHQFLGQFQNVDVDLITAPMKLLVGQLAAGHIDVAVGEMADTQIPRGFEEHRFPPVLQWAYVRSGHPLAQKLMCRWLIWLITHGPVFQITRFFLPAWRMPVPLRAFHLRRCRYAADHLPRS